MRIKNEKNKSKKEVILKHDNIEIKVMIIKCEFNIRPESAKRIETELCSISEDEGVLSFNFKEKEKETR